MGGLLHRRFHGWEAFWRCGPRLLIEFDDHMIASHQCLAGADLMGTDCHRMIAGCQMIAALGSHPGLAAYSLASYPGAAADCSPLASSVSQKRCGDRNFAASRP